MAGLPQGSLVLRVRSSALSMFGGLMFAGLGLLMFTRGINVVSAGFAAVFAIMGLVATLSSRHVVALDPSVPALHVFRGAGKIGRLQTIVLSPGASVRVVRLPNSETGELWSTLHIGTEQVPFLVSSAAAADYLVRSQAPRVAQALNARLEQ